MKEWIEKNLDPPGNERKNWRSIFSFIGRVLGSVKDDAVKAHNAFFPYLCDSDKLRQHGDSLMIPELPFDTEKEYRDRVTTASFYLMRAGERAYIHEQLRAHFGDSYLLTEEFLQVFVKILDLNNAERAWVYGFLDGILDPNISFTISELFYFSEEIKFKDCLKMNIQVNDFEDIYKGRFKFNGAAKFDGVTQNDWIYDYGDYKFNGEYKFNGDINFGKVRKFNRHRLTPPFKFSSWIVDVLNLSIGDIFLEDTQDGLMDDVSIACLDDSPSDVMGSSDGASMNIYKYHRFNGAYNFDGSIKFDGVPSVTVG
jgi:hypothetical protein